MRSLAQFLEGVENIEGVPVCRTLEEQLKTPLLFLATYPDGSVRVFTKPYHSELWDPTVPLRKQI